MSLVNETKTETFPTLIFPARPRFIASWSHKQDLYREQDSLKFETETTRFKLIQYLTIILDYLGQLYPYLFL